MKTYRILPIILISAFLLSSTSCFVSVGRQNSGFKGSSKNSNNPHHPNTTNPGHTKNKHK